MLKKIEHFNRWKVPPGFQLGAVGAAGCRGEGSCRQRGEVEPLHRDAVECFVRKWARQDGSYPSALRKARVPADTLLLTSLLLSICREAGRGLVRQGGRGKVPSFMHMHLLSTFCVPSPEPGVGSRLKFFTRRLAGVA